MNNFFTTMLIYYCLITILFMLVSLLVRFLKWNLVLERYEIGNVSGKGGDRLFKDKIRKSR